MASSPLILFGPNVVCPAFYVCDAETWPTHHHMELQAIETNTWVLLDSQISVFLDPKTKVSSIWEVVYIFF